MKKNLLKFTKNYPFTIRCVLLGIIIAIVILNIEYLLTVIQRLLNFLNFTYSSPHNLTFSLGEAVAALGLIFAVIGLFDKKKDLTLKIKSGLISKLWYIFAILGLISVLIASWLENLEGLNLFYLNSLLWEQIGFIFFIISPFSLWLESNKIQRLFNSKNSERFYHRLLTTVSTGKMEDIEIVVSLVKVNLDELTTAIKNIEIYSYDREIPYSLKYCTYAQELLNVILSDEKVADHIVTSRIDFLFSFLNHMKNKGLSRYTIGRGFDKLMMQLFENPESYLYKQLKYDGLSSYAPIYKTIFGDLYFIKKFSVLKIWNSGIRKNTKHDEEYAQVFVKAIEESIKSCKFQDQSACDEIAFVLHQLVDFTQNILWDHQRKSKAFNQGFWSIERFFGHTFPDLYKKAIEDKTINDYELQVNKGDKYRQSLTASYSLALVELLGEISRADNKEIERHHAMGATHNVLSIIDTGTTFNNLRECILENMWEQISDNVIHGHFPATLRIYISLMYWNSGHLPEWFMTERDKLIKYLYTELAPRIERKELMANYKDTKEKELLPAEIIYDTSLHKYFVIHHNGSKTELI